MVSAKASQNAWPRTAFQLWCTMRETVRRQRKRSSASRLPVARQLRFAQISRRRPKSPSFLIRQSRRLGKLRFVNSAGIMLLAPIQKGDIDNFDKVIATNLRGSYLVISEAANHVVDGGIIVFSSSVLGKSFPSYGAYIASKAGVEGLARVLANELGQRKMTVDAVAPGPVATELFFNRQE